MGYTVKEECVQTGTARRRGPFVTEQEARMVLANAVEQAYDFNPQLAMADVRQMSRPPFRPGKFEDLLCATRRSLETCSSFTVDSFMPSVTG